MAEVLVYAARCTDCGRVGEAARAWDTPHDAPAPLPRCRCGGDQVLEAVDVNTLWLRVSMTGFVAAHAVARVG